MNVQDVVTTAGPWVAAAGGVATAVTALARSIGTRRLRGEVAATARLLKELPEEGARSARHELEGALEVQASRLHARTRDGVRLSRRQSNVVVGGLGLVVNVAWAASLAVLRETGVVSREGPDLVFYRFTWTVAGIGILFSFALFLGGSMAVLDEWLDSRTRHGPRGRRLVGDWIADLPIYIVAAPLLLASKFYRWGAGRRSRRTRTDDE